MNDVAFAAQAAAGPAVDVGGLAVLAAASVAAGAINSVAGGGTILTFPVLAAILPADPARLVIANATSTIGLWPGAAAAAWAYRGERVGQPEWSRWLLVPSVVGAVVGVLLVLRLPPAWFAAAVPWLILLAAVLFAAQPTLARLASVAAPRGPAPPPTAGRLAATWLLQFLVSVYGGYFGAGIGILMLAVLGLLVPADIHRLNGLKNVLGMTINGAAAAMFATGSVAGAHDVSWPCVAVMAVASVLGGLGGSVVARRLPAAVVRRCVAIIGFALAGYYLWREYT
jgi:uncharacterized membrane protein YfcA